MIGTRQNICENCMNTFFTHPSWNTQKIGIILKGNFIEQIIYTFNYIKNNI